MAVAQAFIDGGQQLELKNVVVSTVKPSERTAHVEKYDVALFDVYLPDTFMPMLMLFRPDGKEENRITGSEFVTNIKQSLSRLLVPYYTFAGRFRKTYDLRIRELLCNDEGVPFIEAELDEEMEKVVNLDDFQPLKILSGYEILGFDPYSFYQVDADSLLPACFIQVTKFKCGGISVNATFLHMVGDGKAMFQFLKDWSQMTLENHISFEPIHDRSLIYPLSMLLDMMSAPEASTESEAENLQVQHLYEPLPADGSVHDQMNKLNASLENIGSIGSPPVDTPFTVTEDGEGHMEHGINGNVATAAGGDPKLVDIAVDMRFSLISEWTRKTLHVRKGIVQKLKEDAKDRNDGFVPTALDCIQSYLWRAVSRIPSSLDGRKSTILGVIAEGRQRLHEPPIPDSYSGNDFVLFYSEPIEKPSNDPLAEACIIHQMVRSISPQSWLPLFARALFILNNCSTSDERSLFVSSWYRFPMYEVDFGYGKPILATYNTISSTPPSGYAVIMPPRPGSDYLASVQFVMAPEMLEAMLDDPEFRSFFH